MHMASLYNILSCFCAFLCHPYIFTIFVEIFYCFFSFSVMADEEEEVEEYEEDENENF